MHAGLLDDGGQSGQLKNFNGWKFVEQSVSQLAIADLRARAQEDPIEVLQFVWPKHIAQTLMEEYYR